jgi:uncharacterized protein YutE (UPF0331/DUF86 family)/predicted nucleotidyltransferase
LKVIERIDRQVEQVTELVKELEKERGYRGTERLVQLIIQALLDLGLMVITALGGRTPKGYSEVGELLSDLGVLGEGDAKLLKSMSGMRNILVHAYATIRRDIVTGSASKLRDDAPRIARALKGSLEGKVVDPTSSADLAESLGNVFKGRVRAALLFGGRAKGYSMKGDYDIAVYFGRSYDLYELGELAVDIAEALKVREDQLDVIGLDSASPEMVLEALDGKPIYVEDDYILFELRLKAFMESLDLRSGIQASLSAKAK